MRGKLALTLCLGLVACERGRALASEPKRTLHPLTLSEQIYDAQAGFRNGWKDYGWAPRKFDSGQPARINFEEKGGWIIAKPNLDANFDGLAFRFLAPPSFGDFLEVRLDTSGPQVFPRVKLTSELLAALPDGWVEAYVPMDLLNPERAKFDRIVFRAFVPVGSNWVSLDRIGFDAETAPRVQKVQPGLPEKPIAVTLDCSEKGHTISPFIYGIAFNAMTDQGDSHQWKLGATARRWGGNISSRYNWELGNAWNSANDWFFRNLNYTPFPKYSYWMFLDDNRTHAVNTALTVPIMGWVARDTESCGFPVKEYGPQAGVAPELNNCGNGMGKDGKEISPGMPSRTSVPIGPTSIGRWVSEIRRRDAEQGKRSVQMYILDNEPALWNSTHRDVHPDPVSYDELLHRTIQYGSAVRKADPDAVIAGPAEWGWPAYFFSALDAKVGFRLRPDRLAHGNEPLLPWWLRKVREHEKANKTHLIDVLDVHFYPQGDGIGAGKTDEETNARRLRSTRSLWDPSYVDESWIGEPIRLLPRLKEWISQNAPGVGISIGEWNFGAEGHMSGGLATAEALGRYAEHGITSAFYWTYPEDKSPSFWAFRAFRNYDGKGRAFEDIYIPAHVVGEGASAFASKNEQGNRVVMVLLNLEPRQSMRTNLNLTDCPAGEVRAFRYSGDRSGLLDVSGELESKKETTGITLPPYSITVVEFQK